MHRHPACSVRPRKAWRVGLLLASTLAVLMQAGCASQPEPGTEPARRPAAAAEAGVIASPPGVRRPPFKFSADDARFLDEIQRGCFNFLWNVASPTTGMVYDRSSVQFASIAGVGFQLAALPVGVERGWVTREQGEQRALTIVRALEANPDNRKAGLFYHYLDGQTAGPERDGPELVVSTIDSAILLAGVAVAGSYFGGETRRIGDGLLDGADWSFFVSGEPSPPHERGFISLGWKPADPSRPTGDGALLPYSWIDSGDEHRLVCFMAMTPRHEGGQEARHVDPAMYYRLRRQLGAYKDTGPLVWFPWSGALFTAFFAHCFIDYAHAGPDDPAAFGVERRVRVDWWENSRRLVRLHQLKCAENPLGLPTLGENGWGLTASDSPEGYAVPGLFPDPLPMPGALPDLDFANVEVKDKFGDGTIAPYGAGCAILFDPARALAALRYARDLKSADGRPPRPLVWRDPAAGGFGFQDAFNLDVNLGEPGGQPWSAPDCVAIDQGPLILCIENARTGLIWRHFRASEPAARAARRLGLGMGD